MLLSVLLACDPPRWACHAPEDAPITDPEGLADEATLADLARAAELFQVWTDDLPACVGEIRVVSRAGPEDEVVGMYSTRSRILRVELDPEVRAEEVLFHELCHAIDDAAGFSTSMADLFERQPLPALYDGEDVQNEEYFARACEVGPSPGALLAAYQETCGWADPLELALRETVWTGWDDVEVGSAGPLGFSPVSSAPDIGAVGDEVGLFGFVADGDAASWAVAWWDGAGHPQPIWTGSARFLYPGLGAAPPVLVYGDERVEVASVGVDGLTPWPDEGWVEDLWTRSATLGFGPGVAWYQVWGDGQPLQVRDLATGVVTAQPGDEGLALSAPLLLDHDTPVAPGWYAAPSSPRLFALHDDAVQVVDAPSGITSVVVLPDGRWLGGWELQGAGRWVVGTPGGGWLLPETSCDGFDGYGPPLRAGDRVYSDGADFLALESAP